MFNHGSRTSTAINGEELIKECTTTTSEETIKQSKNNTRALVTLSNTENSLDKKPCNENVTAKYDDWQTVLCEPLSCRNKDLIERSFILGVAKGDTTRSRKRKRVLREENEKEVESYVIIPNTEVQSDAEDSDAIKWGEYDCYDTEGHPFLKEVQEIIVNW